MKKIILISILFITVKYSFGQVDSTKWLIGGSFNFSIQKNNFPVGTSAPLILSLQIPYGVFTSNLDDAKYSRFSFFPYIGKKINDKWLVGARAEVEFYNRTLSNFLVFGQQGPSEIKSKDVALGLGLITRRYYNISSTLKLFIQPELNFNTINSDSKRNGELTDERNSWVLSMGASPGISWSPFPRLNFIASLGYIRYSYGNTKQEDIGQQLSAENNFHAFNTSFNLRSFGIGLEVKL